jgi:hypothetical protein
MADTQVLEACASAWGFESPLPHQTFIFGKQPYEPVPATPASHCDVEDR